MVTFDDIPLNALFATFLFDNFFVLITIFFSFLHPPKAFFPILFTLDGIVIVVNLSQL